MELSEILYIYIDLYNLIYFMLVYIFMLHIFNLYILCRQYHEFSYVCVFIYASCSVIVVFLASVACVCHSSK